MNAERVLVLVASLMLATVLADVFMLRSSLAQTGSKEMAGTVIPQRTMLEACTLYKSAIEASELSASAGQPCQRVLDTALCPIKGRLITDNGVGNHVPPRGESVYIDTYGPGVSQEFGIVHRQDGTILLDFVGNEAGNILNVLAARDASRTKAVRTAASAECSQNAWNNAGFRFDGARFRWYFNRSSTPGELITDNALNAIRDGATNMVNVRNECGIGDGARVSFEYLGNTNTYADIPPDPPYRCGSNDNKREVSFGNLPADPRIGVAPAAASCSWVSQTGGEISDIKFNKHDGYEWTAKGAADAQCSDGNPSNNPWPVEAIATHERGHNLGLAHVSERYYGALTMSADPEGPCQSSENTLGRGDALGMNYKY